MPTDAGSDLDVSAVESIVDKADQAAAKLEGQDRSAIAKRIVLLYIVSVLTCIVFVLGIVWFLTPCTDGVTTGCVEWQGPAEFLLKVLTTTVLPIVTLVLGYYFGTAKSEAGGEPG